MKKIGISVAVSVAVSVSEQKTKIPPEAGYYFSATGNDANDGLTPETAKKSLDVGSLDFTTLKKVFLERGSEFEESITVNSSGTSGSPIIIDAFGVGAKPKLIGSEVITEWTLHAGNVYKATVNDAVSQVFCDGERMMSARFPKIRNGYLSISSVNGTSEFTANDLSSESSDYYKGAIAAIRGLPYHLNFRNVSGSTGNTMTLGSALDTLGATKPFFLLNKLEFLTESNEWYYDSANKLLYIWTPNGDSPDNYVIRASTKSKGITIGNRKNFVTIRNLAIEQFTDNAIYSTEANDLIINNCDISKIQGIAIRTETAGNRLSYSNNNISDVFTAGIIINYGDDYTIERNNIDRIGLLESMGNIIPPRNNVGLGIVTLHGNADIRYNKITNVGYNGIYWNSGLAHIYRNYVNGACQVLNDGGGIYTFSESNSIGSLIEENIILNTFGTWALIGRYRLGFGIYLDGGTEGIEVKNNTVALSGGGVNINGGGNNIIHGNLFYANVVGVNSPSQSSANIIEYNKFYQGAGTDDLPSLPNTHHRFAIVEGDELDEFDYNTYVAPYIKTGIFRGESGNFADFAAWQGSGQDANSSYDGTNKAIGYNDALIFNWTDSNKNFYLNNASNLEDVFTKDNIEDNFILTPYKSKVLSGINSDTVLDYEDSTPPTITEFEIPESHTELTVPITSIITSDDVTQYIITRNDTVPALNDANWSKEKPTSYIFNTSGEKELYLWVRDEAGNISNYKLAEVEISVEFPAEDKLVHAWELNDLTGGTVTDSFGSNDGTASGTSIVNGLLNKAREFDGIDDFVSFTLPTEIDAYLTKDFSVSLWINLKSIINSSVILDFTQSWRTSVIIRMSSSGSYFVFAVNKYNTAIGTISSDTVSTNEWIHLVITYDSSEEEMKFYMNKVLQTDGTNRGIVQATVAGARLGSRVDDTRHTNAIYDQTLFFNKTLTAEEVIALNNNGNGIEL